MSLSPSRRAIVAGLAAAPVAGLPAIASGATGDDPVFAAIERHREARQALTRACRLTNKVLAEPEGREVTEADKAEHSRWSIAEDQARLDLANTMPTTRDGARAALEHLVALRADEDIVYFAETLLQSPVLAG